MVLGGCWAGEEKLKSEVKDPLELPQLLGCLLEKEAGLPSLPSSGGGPSRPLSMTHFMARTNRNVTSRCTSAA